MLGYQSVSFPWKCRWLQFTKRIMAMQTQIGLTNITSAQMSDIQFDTLAGNLNKLRGLPLYVDDSSLIKVFFLISRLKPEGCTKAWCPYDHH